MKEGGECLMGVTGNYLDEKIMETIEKIKGHEWIKVIESEEK